MCLFVAFLIGNGELSEGIGVTLAPAAETPAAAVLLPACLQQLAAHSRFGFVCSIINAAAPCIVLLQQQRSSNAPPTRFPLSKPAPHGCAAPTPSTPAPLHPSALPLPLTMCDSPSRLSLLRPQLHPAGPSCVHRSRPGAPQCRNTTLLLLEHIYSRPSPPFPCCCPCACCQLRTRATPSPPRPCAGRTHPPTPLHLTLSRPCPRPSCCPASCPFRSVGQVHVKHLHPPQPHHHLQPVLGPARPQDRSLRPGPCSPPTRHNTPLEPVAGIPHGPAQPAHGRPRS